MIDFAVIILVPVAGFISSILAGLINAQLLNNKEQQEDISVRIKLVTDVLSDSIVELDLLQKELGKRIELVEKLKNEADQAEQIIKLTEGQVKAFKNTLNQELQKESKKSFWQGVLVNFIFFILGAFASYIVSKYLV